MISLATQIEVAQTVTSLNLGHTQKVREDIHRDSLVPQQLAEERNIRTFKAYLWGVVNSRGLYSGPTVIHGVDGPVRWERLRDHPKSKKGNSRWRTDKLVSEIT